ncbi:hypothetical protein [Psychroserpens jangbogonensis]|uniref:hypothetical protein n=1 Tax=Psychroserpens jangbogonensis TaxID=1484460 RepID=UPI00053D1942|nr:hypothetical protein [Psychroserpens jangbogonensis]
MNSSFNFKDNKILKPITIVILLYSILMFFNYIENLAGFVFKPKNPLIPEYLTYYIAFPAYFILPFFLVVILICIRFLKTKQYQFHVVFFLFGMVFLFFIFQWKIYEYLMHINPYGS